MAKKGKRLTTTAEYVVNLDSGRVHRRFRIDGTPSLADFPQCNLDQIAVRRDVANREEIPELLGRKTPRPCKRCFRPPTREQEKVNAEIPIDEGPTDVDPQAEEVSLAELDPEDREEMED